MVDRLMPRIQEVIFPVLRQEMPDVVFGSWTADVDFRVLPLINVRRLGGNSRDPKRIDRAVIEMTCYCADGIVATEDHYLDARQVLFEMVEKQTVIPSVGHLSSFTEVLGPTPFDSSIEDTWRVQGLIQLGIRPTRS